MANGGLSTLRGRLHGWLDLSRVCGDLAASARAAADRPVVLIVCAVAGLEDNLSSGRRRLCRSNGTACSSGPRDLGGVTAPLTARDSLILPKKTAGLAARVSLTLVEPQRVLRCGFEPSRRGNSTACSAAPRDLGGVTAPLTCEGFFDPNEVTAGLAARVSRSWRSRSGACGGFGSSRRRQSTAYGEGSDLNEMAEGLRRRFR